MQVILLKFFFLFVVFALPPVYSKSVGKKQPVSNLLWCLSFMSGFRFFFFSAAATVEAFYSFSHYCIFQTVLERQWCMVESFQATGDNGTALL